MFVIHLNLCIQCSDRSALHKWTKTFCLVPLNTMSITVHKQQFVCQAKATRLAMCTATAGSKAS